MQVFVTGGNGFIGSAVVRTLLARGHRVRCLLRRTSRTERIDGLLVERVFGDVRDLESVRAGMSGCDGVVHLASISGWQLINSPLVDDIIVGGTRNILEAAQAAGHPRVVYISSTAAVCGSKEPKIHNEGSVNSIRLSRYRYARAKSEAEGLCRRAAASGLPVIIANPGEVYGPNDTERITSGNLIDFATHSPALTCSGGASITYLDDAAEAIVTVLEKGRPGERYILGGENVTIRQLAEMTIELLGQRKKVLTMPNGVLRFAAWAGRRFRIPLPFNPEVIPYATLYWFTDSSKARNELGVSFRPARETLALTLKWLSETGYIGENYQPEVAAMVAAAAGAGATKAKVEAPQ
jgi:dihydroflavonol-4-reductase